MAVPVILLAFANDRQGSFLRGIAEEQKAIMGALAPAIDSNACKVVILPDASANDIVQAFQKHKEQVCIFHYGGHADGHALLLASGDGAQQVEGKHLADFLREQDSLELVFLNGCSSRGQAEGLLGASIPNVIATSQAINDSSARDIASHFYHALASGSSLSEAFAEAQAAVLMQSGGQTRSLYWEGMEEASNAGDPMPWHWFGEKNTRVLADFHVVGQVNTLLTAGNFMGAVQLLQKAADNDTQREALTLVAIQYNSLLADGEISASDTPALRKLTGGLLALAREIGDPDSAAGTSGSTALLAALSNQPQASILGSWTGTVAYLRHEGDDDAKALAENWDGYMRSVTIVFAEDGHIHHWNNFGTCDTFTYRNGQLTVFVADGAGGFSSQVYMVEELSLTKMVVYDPNTDIVMELEPVAM